MPDKTAKMFRANLAATDITYRDDGGHISDFHSLRLPSSRYLFLAMSTPFPECVRDPCILA